MFAEYFIKHEKEILKKAKSRKTTKGQSDKGTKSKKQESTSFNDLIERLNKMIPSHPKIDTNRLIDASGYSPKGVDFIVYKEYFRDIVNMMGGFVPAELTYATYHVSPNVNKKGLPEVLDRVVQTKKVSRYIDREKESPLIPAFIIAYDSSYTLPELKNAILEYYMSKGIGHEYECDIIAILHKGIIIKNWREKRSYIALETKDDTLMWYIILMNEYLEVDRGEDFDLRDYVKQSEKYEEY